MDAHWLWWGLAVVVAIGEVASGSFYLLVLAAAAVAGGLVALVGAGLTAQMLVVAVVAFVGWWLLRRWRAGQRGEVSGPASGSSAPFDVGQTVEVAQWQSGGRARVRYRGADWDARLAPGGPTHPRPGSYRILAVDGNCLVIESV
jgi:membrane protein implicated in regulation of membrane protease activity